MPPARFVPRREPLSPLAPIGTKLRVLALLKGLGVGGAEQLFLWQTQLSDRERVAFEVAYLVPAKDALVRTLSDAGVASHCLSATGYQLGWARRLRQLLVARRYDIVHVHSPYVAAITRLVVRSLPKRVRPALVSTEHNVWPRFTVATRLANALTFPLTDAQFAVSTAVRNSIPKLLRSRVEVLVHGVPLDGVEQALAESAGVRAELELAPDDIAVIAVANLRVQKGYPILLRAARAVIDADPRVRFFAVGQGPLESEVKRIHAELGLDDRFRFLGYRSDAIRLIAGCDIFVLASTYEGYPIALMEALSVGVPVVATPVGGVPDAVTDGVEGLLVPMGDPERLAERLLQLADDAPLRKQMSVAAIARSGEYDMARAARRLDETYLALASVGSRKG